MASGGHGQPSIHRTRNAKAMLIFEEDNLSLPRKLVYNLNTIVGRAIVNDNDLIERPGLANDRSKRRLQFACVVSVWQDQGSTNWKLPGSASQFFGTIYVFGHSVQDLTAIR
jgi:hypothetical protein